MTIIPHINLAHFLTDQSTSYLSNDTANPGKPNLAGKIFLFTWPNGHSI